MGSFNELQAAALSLSNDGYYIFPCQPGGKAPLTLNGFKDASNDPAQVMQWWNRWPNANIGLVTGQINGRWVLDIDPDKGGENSLQELERKYGKLPQTIEVITGSGGRHLYFSWSAQSKIINSAGKLGDGLDVRGDGGYVIAPPSLHPCGRKYQWSFGNSLQPAPYWLIELVQSSTAIRQGKNPEEWRELLKGVVEGQRNDSVARIAGKLLQANLDPIIALDLCLCWNQSRCVPPLPDNEVIQTVNSIAGKELVRRRGK